MYKLLSCSKSIYRERYLNSDADYTYVRQSIDSSNLKSDLKSFFSSTFTLENENELFKTSHLGSIDCFNELVVSKVYSELKLFLNLFDILNKLERLDILKSDYPARNLCQESGIALNEIGKHSDYLCSIGNHRWKMFVKYLYDEHSCVKDQLVSLRENLDLFILKNRNEDSVNFSNSFDSYKFFLRNNLLKKSDFIASQTLVVYEDKELYLSISGESPVIRELTKFVYPNLLTRPSISFSEKLNAIFKNIFQELDQFENISPERLSSISNFLSKCKLDFSNEVKKDVFKQNFYNKFLDFNLSELGQSPMKKVSEMTSEDIEHYFDFDSETINSKNELQSSLIKVFQALLLSKMWCAEKAIMHDLSKNDIFIDLSKVEAFVFNKFVYGKKSKIKVCSHCVLLSNFLRTENKKRQKTTVPNTPSKSPGKLIYERPFRPIELSGVSKTLFPIA